VRVMIDRVVLRGAGVTPADAPTFRTLLTHELSAALEPRAPTSATTDTGAVAPTTRAVAREAAHKVAATVRREARA
jgi:hypothetical protein